MAPARVMKSRDVMRSRTRFPPPARQSYEQSSDGERARGIVSIRSGTSRSLNAGVERHFDGLRSTADRAVRGPNDIVVVRRQGYHHHQRPALLQPAAAGTLSHLVRNATAHGIERQERLKQAKPPAGRIALRAPAGRSKALPGPITAAVS